MTYIESEQEMRENPHAIAWMRYIAKGDEDAFRFLLTVWNWNHVLDDLVDRDKPVDAETAARWCLALIRELSFNPFYQRNSAYLYGLIVSMFARWLDGDEWQRSNDPEKRAYAPVVRCGDVDFALGVAYLTGGWDHLRACKDARSYDPPKE
jgi:hypothetical protein